MNANKKMFINLIYKNLSLRINKSLIILISIIVGTSIIFSFLNIYYDISNKMSKELKAYGANFFIIPTKLGENINLDEYKNVLKKIDKNKITGQSPLLYGLVRLDLAKAVLLGINFKEAKKINPFWQIEGSWIGVDFDEKNAMIGKKLAKKMELKLGSIVSIQSKSFNKQVKIKGIIESGGNIDNQILVNFNLARKILQTPNEMNHAILSLNYNSKEIEKIAKKINQTNKNLKAKVIRKISHSEGKILDKIKALMGIVAFIILIINTLCLNTTLSSIIIERRKEIALQKVLGADNKDIIKQFLSEISIISILGLLLGLFFGYILSQIMGKAIFNSNIDLNLITIPITFTISFLATLIATIIPVKKALKILPAKVLKGE